ncbi:GGDEF domain-containing protein [Pararhizobium sp.]|uniref:GGDEF domain-containing protein n=1 Tax=Pararhizobium sp. TaxID=1977563 RepID=UPI002721853D|nr:GGDEF domain-containing protein [Pararhizobium sp.]MDO9418900.1 GGDEF domain-containing protein [Pararhizobium sp.]
MLERVVSIETLMLCTFLSTAIVGVFMTQLWFQDRSRAVCGLWASSMWLGSAGSLLLALRGGIPDIFSICLGNFLAALAYGVMWAGFRSFEGRPFRWTLSAAGALFWLALYLTVPAVAVDTNARIISMSLVIFFYSAAIARTVSSGSVNDYLPTRSIAAFFFASHGLLYLFRIPFAVLFPLPLALGIPNSAWFSAFSVELFIHTVVTCVTMLTLLKERNEYQHKRAAETDDLTGIKNRRSFVSNAEDALAGSPSGGVLFLLDLDHFKRINDTFGHVAGDTVLAAFAKRVSSEIPGKMIFGRFGGEEFALFAPGFDQGEGLAYAGMLCRMIEKMAVVHDGHRMAVTVSIGMSTVAELGADFGRLLAGADIALYRAKGGGRNRVATYQHGDELRRAAGHSRLTGIVPANANAS